MADHSSGRKAVQGEIAAALSGAVAAVDAKAAGDQLPLFPVPISPVNHRTGEVHDVAALQARAEGRRVGRPEGAVNKSSARMREYLLARGVNPAEWLIRWLSVSPDELASYLGCTTLEAFREQRIVASDLVPVFLPRMAPTDDRGQVVPQVNVSIGGQPGAAGPGLKPWEYLLSEQSVTTVDVAVKPATSHGDNLSRPDKSEADQSG